MTMSKEMKTFDNQCWKELMFQQREKNVIEDGKELFDETWEDVTPEFEKRVKDCLEGTDKDNWFNLAYVAKPLGNHYVICIHGGQNGSGIWQEYLDDCKIVFANLTDEHTGPFKDIWLIDWKNDCADDVFDLWIGVRK